MPVTPKIHSCIESTSDSTLRSHTRPKLGFSLLFLSNQLRYHFQSERCSYLCLFMTMLIRLSWTNRKDYYYALGASFRNLFLKRTKYFAHNYYRKSSGLKQDLQNLVGRRRPFGTPLPTRPCITRLTFTQWLNLFTSRLTRKISVKTNVVLEKYSYYNVLWIVSNDLTVLPADCRDENRGLLLEENL